MYNCLINDGDFLHGGFRHPPASGTDNRPPAPLINDSSGEVMSPDHSGTFKIDYIAVEGLDWNL